MEASPIKWVFLSMLVIVSMLLPEAGPAQGATNQAPALTNSDHALQAPGGKSLEKPDSPVVVRVYYKSQVELEKMASTLDIWETHPGEGYLLAMLTPVQYAHLAGGGYRLEIDFGKTMLLSRVNRPLPGQINGIPGYPCYRTVEETNTDMTQLATDHPNLATYIVIGQSWDKAKPGGPAGYDLKVLVVTNKNVTVAKQKFFLMAEIHAREYVTAETAARFAEYLVNQYGVNPDVTWMLDYFEVHILVMTNPDGRKKAETGLSWRKNTDTDDNCASLGDYGVDLNRNAAFKWGGAGSSSDPCGLTFHGRSPASEPEVQAVQTYLAAILPDLRGPLDTDIAPDTYPGLFLTLHSYSGLVLYPWGWTDASAPNGAGLSTLGRKFGYYNHYTVQQSIGLYPTTGTTDDWAYATLGVPAYTFEMGNDFFQDCGYFESTIYPDNFNAIFYGAKTTRMPYRISYGPEVVNVTTTPSALKSGGSFDLKGTADSTRYSAGQATRNIAAARYSIDKPSWEPTAVTIPMNGSFNTSTTVEVTATVSTAGWEPGKHMVFVEAKNIDGMWGVPTAIYVEISTFGLTITPSTDAREAARGTTANYTLRVTNIGNAVDTFHVQTSSTLGWVVSAPAVVGPVPLGGFQDFNVQLAVPEGVTVTTPDTTTVTLTSTGDPATANAATLTTSVMLTFRAFIPVVIQ
jgi:carboxypeptidase T